MAFFNNASSNALKKTFQHLSYWDPVKPNAIAPSKQVVTCFIQKGNKILVLQRARKDEQHKLWGIPGGKLDKDELPVPGLLRELREETGLIVSPSNLTLLGTALSHTSCDGQYGLYLFHTKIPENTEIKINLSEHYTYKWVTLKEFKSMNLLTAQGEAYQLVKKDLKNILNRTSSKGVVDARQFAQFFA